MYFSDAAHLDAVPAPRLGQHTDEVLSTVLGLSAAQIWHAARPEDRRVTEGGLTSSIDIGGPYFEDLACGLEFESPAVTLTDGHAALFQAVTATGCGCRWITG
jgi:hypothetical protein